MAERNSVNERPAPRMGRSPAAVGIDGWLTEYSSSSLGIIPEHAAICRSCNAFVVDHAMHSLSIMQCIRAESVYVFTLRRADAGLPDGRVPGVQNGAFYSAAAEAPATVRWMISSASRSTAARPPPSSDRTAADRGGRLVETHERRCEDLLNGRQRPRGAAPSSIRHQPGGCSGT
jgi:hypothetical protein